MRKAFLLVDKAFSLAVYAHPMRSCEEWKSANSLGSHHTRVLFCELFNPITSLETMPQIHLLHGQDLNIGYSFLTGESQSFNL